MATFARLATVAAPGSEPITTAEAKLHCGIASADTYHDTYIGSLITAARQKWEIDTDQVVMSSSVVETLDEWPLDDAIALLKRPVSAVTSIQYYDTAATLQTWSSSNYTLDTRRTYATIYPAYDLDWPTLRGWRGDITITYVAGHANAAAVPTLWKQAMLLLVGHWFETRTAAVGGSMTTAPIAYEALATNFMRSSYP